MQQSAIQFLCTFPSMTLLADEGINHQRLHPQALMWWTGRTTAAMFGAWVQHTQRQRRRKLDGARALFNYAGMLKRKAFLAWQEAVEDRRALRQQAAHAFANMADFKLCMAFDAW